MTEPHINNPDDWHADWKAHEAAQLKSWLTATPAQRLEWLEETLQLAYEFGALSIKSNKQDGIK
ncbi:MAG: hypothetical protein A2W28_13015 [Gammaproteobacteria bacterium RBG_16_51_14]|nr:MAG: hypothetical protein A2W28_13015 [Gammaproteobacteria bacterium RBG_16_51_14]